MYDPYRDSRIDDLHKARDSRPVGSSETGMVLARLQNAMNKGWKIPWIEIEIQGWAVIALTAGFIFGNAVGKMLDHLAIGRLLKGLTGGTGFEGLMTVLGVVAAGVLWVKLQHSLKFIRTMAVLMVLWHLGATIGAILDEESSLRNVLIGALIALLVALIFPYLGGVVATVFRKTPEDGKQYVIISTLVVLVVILLQPPLSLVANFDLFKLPPLVWLGAPGGFVLASLWGTALWYWGGD